MYSIITKDKIIKIINDEFLLNPIRDKIHYAGRFYSQEEISYLIDSCLDFTLTNGKYISLFEKKLKDFTKSKFSLFVNSGSSANLLAFMSLTSRKLKNRRIKRGDEIITVATCFPTTISPIINYGAIPVFVDIEKESLNIDCSQLETALSEKTKAVFLAHTLGNPFDLEKIRFFCDKHNLWLIQDSCDSLGALFNLQHIESYGDIATYSFYPAHHITTGQGGAITTNNKELYNIVRSLRDWGRDYKCNTCYPECSKRHNNNYDCRYEYSEFGYNLNATEMQAAIGCAQFEKLHTIYSLRKNNFKYLYDKLIEFQEYFILPTSLKESNPVWFSFPITIKENCKFNRIKLVKYLEENNIETRFIFAGNIIQQKCFSCLQENIDYRIIGNLENTNYIYNNSFFVGIYPGNSYPQLDKIYNTIKNFIMSYYV